MVWMIRYSRSNWKSGSYIGTDHPRRHEGEPMSDSNEPDDRPDPPQAANEVTTVLGFLDYQRATFAWKCAGVDAAGLTARVGVSTMTLGGLLKHLAYVEDDWFSRWLFGNEKAAPWNTVDWSADRDWEWNSAVHDTPEALHALWRGSVERSRELVAMA